MTDTTSPTALGLLKRAEALLSALHGSVARHDNLAANLGCAGCELRDQISAALPSLAAAPAALPPAADRATLSDADRQFLTFALDLAADQMASRGDEFNADDEDAMERLRRLADEQQPGGTAFSPGEGVHGRDPYYASSDTEAQQAETQAHPAEHTWAAELHDPLTKEWVPGTRYVVRERAMNALAHARRIGPTWKDGTPTDRRLVRATTTYTVEDEHTSEQPS